MGKIMLLYTFIFTLFNIGKIDDYWFIEFCKIEFDNPKKYFNRSLFSVEYGTYSKLTVNLFYFYLYFGK